jgi:hypothetical protein
MAHSSDELAQVVAVHLPEKGRGRALKRVWLGHSDIAIGTRLACDSRVIGSARREFVSRGYNLLLRGAMSVRFSDAQCGFKAVRRDVAQQFLPLIEDDGWFFDTELLIIAERSGPRIHEVPVDWIDDPHSSVDVDLAAPPRLFAATVPVCRVRAVSSGNKSDKRAQ